MNKKLKRILYRFKPFDKRAFDRYHLAVVLKGTCVYDSSEGLKEFPCELINVSEDGALISTFDNKIGHYAPVEIKFQLPSNAGAVGIKAEVLRTFRQGVEPGHYSALEFLEREQPDIKKLIEFVAGITDTDK